MRGRLPSLYALRVFETAGRHEHFTRAADEIGISQGAVSYQIKTLEDDLGFALFRRVGRSVKLSKQGAKLLPVLQSSFADIAGMISDLQRSSAEQAAEVAIATTTYFASRWLSPRLPRFMALHPDVGIRVTYARASGGHVSPHDLEVRWGDGKWSGIKAELLFEADLMPVCSPKLLGKNKGGFPLDDLRKIAFLHDDETKNAWKKFLKRTGIKDPDFPFGPVIGDPSVRMQAVIDCQGFALADWLVNDDLSNRRMIAPFDISVSGYGYYLIPEADELSPSASHFADWLRTEASINHAE